MRLAISTAAVGMALLGCGERFSGVETTPAAGGTTAEGGNGGVGGAPGGAGGMGGAVPPLVDRGLVARYYIDEADNGFTPTQLEDSAPQPFALPITYTTELRYRERNGNRGLEWNQTGDDGIAIGLIGDNKIRTMLQGSTTATLEVVARVESVTNNASRLLWIGQNAQVGHLAMYSDLLGEMTLIVNDAIDARFVVSTQNTRRVYHGVYGGAGGVLRLYVDGQAAMLTDETGVETPIIVAQDMSLAVGNRQDLSRSIQGMILYAAIYFEALTVDEVKQNAQALLASDDTPVMP